MPGCGSASIRLSGAWSSVGNWRSWRPRWASACPDGLLHAQYCPALRADLQVVARAQPEQLAAERGVRRDQGDRHALGLQLQAGAVGAQQQALLAALGADQPDQRAELDALRLVVGARRQGAPGGQGATDLGGAARLPGGQVGGL